MDTRNPNCPDCMATKPTELMGKVYHIMCDKCAEERDAQNERELSEKAKSARLAFFESICPMRYRDTDPDRVHGQCRAQLLWEPNGDGNGIGIIGDAGTGKTRTMFAILKRLHVERGISVDAVSGTRLAKLAMYAWGGGYGEDIEKANAKQSLDRFATAGVLLLDDLGKEKYTERAEIELYDLLETRSAHMRPILWTSNCNANVLSKKLSDSNSDAVLRRLSEFSEVIKIK